MKIYKVTDEAFVKYGKVVEGYCFDELLAALEKDSEKPADAVVYYPSIPAFEALPVFQELSDRCYGGMPIQIGYCNGSNHLLNALEYHRDSEIDIAGKDLILLLGKQEDIRDGKYDTAKVEAFLLPAGVGAELYATTLHFAPCETVPGAGFTCIVVLPKGTNTDRPEITPACLEDQMLNARNKWLIAHPDSDQAKEGAFIGLTGENISVF